MAGAKRASSVDMAPRCRTFQCPVQSCAALSAWIPLSISQCLASPSDIAGISASIVQVTPDGKYWAYTYVRALSELYLAEGVK